MEISQEISGSQLNPLKSNIFFDHLKEDMTLPCKVINIDYLTETCVNNLKSLASIFQVAIRFLLRHLQPKTANSFSILI